MFKGVRAIQIYAILGLTGIFAYIIQKLVELNWFANAGFITIVLMGFAMLVVNIVTYNLIEWSAKSWSKE